MYLLCNEPPECQRVQYSERELLQPVPLQLPEWSAANVRRQVSYSTSRTTLEHLSGVLARAILPSRLRRGAPCTPLSVVAGRWTRVFSRPDWFCPRAPLPDLELPHLSYPGRLLPRRRLRPQRPPRSTAATRPTVLPANR